MSHFDDKTLTPPVTPPLKNPLVGFWIHATVFAVTMALLFLFDMADGEREWVFYVFGGWGIGVVAHGLAALLKKLARTD